MKHPVKDQKALERYRQLIKSISEEHAVNPFESQADQNLRIDRAKRDYGFFIDTYFKRYASSPSAGFHLLTAKKIKANKYIKLLLAWGRGLAKSTHLNILIPLWLWINDDLKVMLLVGQNQEKACILLSDLQAEFEANPLLAHDFGSQQSMGSWEEGRFITRNDCAFFALGMGQSPRGLRHRQFRPDYIVADDLDTKEICRNPKRLREYANWIAEDLLGTLDERGSRFVQVNNIFAPQTLLTYIRDHKKGFQYIQQNATDTALNPLWPEKYTRAFYQNQLDAMGPLSFQAEYNNAPYMEGTIFKQEAIRWCPLPHSDHFERIVGYWDVAYSEAKTADFNAIKVWGLKEGKFYLIKAMVQQCRMESALCWMFDYSASLPPSVRINWYFESQFWNDALKMVYQEVAKRYAHSISLIQAERPKGNKFDRMMAMLPFYQQVRIYYNQAERLNGDMQVGIAQLLALEPGYKSHDDSPDADAAALDLLNRYQRSAAFKPRTGAYKNFSTRRM
jgi:phage terminase large subunit-like protein